MRDASSAEMLLARLELRQEDVPSVVISAPRSNVQCLFVARQIAMAAERMGRKVRIVRLSRSAPPRSSTGPVEEDESALSASDTSPREVSIDVDDLRNQERARVVLHEFAGLSVIVGGGILDDAATLLAVRTSKCVVVVAQVGKTMRSELRDVRIQIGEAGGWVAGAIQLG